MLDAHTHSNVLLVQDTSLVCQRMCVCVGKDITCPPLWAGYMEHNIQSCVGVEWYTQPMPSLLNECGMEAQIKVVFPLLWFNAGLYILSSM